MNDMERFKNELALVGKIGDVLKAGQWNGQWAQDVAISQMYIQGLHAELKKQLDVKKAEPFVESKAEVVPAHLPNVADPASAY